jgi:hypothetical protein
MRGGRCGRRRHEAMVGFLRIVEAINNQESRRAISRLWGILRTKYPESGYFAPGTVTRDAPERALGSRDLPR